MDLLQFVKNTLSVHPALEQHCDNVAHLAGKVSFTLKLANREDIVFAAYLHDIGKSTWPRELFSKYPLQPYDWSLVKAHPLAGENLLQNSGRICPHKSGRLCGDITKGPEARVTRTA